MNRYGSLQIDASLLQTNVLTKDGLVGERPTLEEAFATNSPFAFAVLFGSDAWRALCECLLTAKGSGDIRYQLSYGPKWRGEATFGFEFIPEGFVRDGAGAIELAEKMVDAVGGVQEQWSLQLMFLVKKNLGCFVAVIL